MNYHEIIVNFYPEEFEYSKKSGQRKNNSWKNYSLRLIKLKQVLRKAHQAEASRRTDFYNAEKWLTSSIPASWLLVFSSAGYIM